MSKARNVRTAMGLITMVTASLQAQMEYAEHEDLILGLPESEKIWIAQNFAARLAQAGKYHAYVSGINDLVIAGVDSSRTEQLISNLSGKVGFGGKSRINPSVDLPDPSTKDLRFRVHTVAAWAKNYGRAVDSLHKSGLRPAEGREAVWFLADLIQYQEYARSPEIINVIGEQLTYRISFARNYIQFFEWGSTYSMKEDNLASGSLVLGSLLD